MADLPRIQADNLYPDRFIVSLGISTLFRNGLQQKVEVHLRPYNYDTKEILPGDDAHPLRLAPTDEEFIIDNIYLEAARVPLLAQTMGAITLVTALMINERKVQAKIDKALVADPEADVSALQTELANIRTQLGIT